MIGRGGIWLPPLVGLCVVAILPGRLSGQATEADVKAAYVFNFGKYIRWPKEAAGGENEKFLIGVLGKSPVEPVLDKAAQEKNIQGKSIVVLHFASLDKYRPCHVLFVAGVQEGEKDDAAEERLSEVLKKTKGQPVLVVAETEGMAAKGAVINFFIDDNRVKFEINPDAAKEAKLQISAKLLQVGKIVSSSGK
jgi:hypothetical protein